MLAGNVTDGIKFSLLNMLSWIADAGVYSHAVMQGMFNSDTFLVNSRIQYNVSMSSYCIA